MKSTPKNLAILAACCALSGMALASPETLLATYRQAGAGGFSASAGAAAWTRTHTPADAKEPRSCADCHGTDLTKPGKHVQTGKRIDPLALSVNPERLADDRKAEKWLGRNCRWTLGRDCTAQEKGDFVVFLQGQ